MAEPRELKLRPETVVEAKFSVYVTVALALAEGVLDLGSLTPGRALASDALGLAGRIRFEAAEGFGVTAGRVEVTTTGGQLLSEDVPVALGAPENPISEGQLLAKYLDCMSHAAAPLDPASTRALADRILGLEEATDAASALSLLAELPPAPFG